MSSLSMRSIVFLCQLKKCSIAPWKIFTSISWLALVRAAGVSIWTFLLSLWLGRQRELVCCPIPCALALGLRGTWNTMSKMIWQRLSSGPPRSLRWRSPTKLPKSFLFVVGGLLGLPTVCSNGCAILPRSWAMAWLTIPLPTRPSLC